MSYMSSIEFIIYKYFSQDYTFGPIFGGKLNVP
jgi:hypothetical protein